MIFGLVRGAGAFAVVLPTFVLVSRIQLVQRYRGTATSFSAASSSRREAMIASSVRVVCLQDHLMARDHEALQIGVDKSVDDPQRRRNDDKYRVVDLRLVPE